MLRGSSGPRHLVRFLPERPTRRSFLPLSHMNATQGSKPLQVFLCYRRRDGARYAEFVYRALHDTVLGTTQDGERRIHVYYDRTAPGVANWKALHFPSLESSHALVLISTPGTATEFAEPAEPDWVYAELRWWLEHRSAAPIVIDTTGDGTRWLPKIVTNKWPDINRIDLLDVDIADERQRAECQGALRLRIVGTIRESEQATVFDNLQKERRLTRGLRIALSALSVLLLLLAASVVMTIRAGKQTQESVLANASYSFSDRDPTIALRFALMSEAVGPSPTMTLAVLRAFNTGSWFYSHRVDNALDGDLDRAGNHLAWIDASHTLHRLDLQSGLATTRAVEASNLRFLPNGNLLLWRRWEGPGSPGSVELLRPDGKLLARHELNFLNIAVSDTGTSFVPAFEEHDDVVVSVIDGVTGALAKLDLDGRVKSLGQSVVALPDGSGMVLATWFPDQVLIARSGVTTEVVEVAAEYSVVSLDVNAAGNRAAAFLSGRQKAVDAVGWIDLSAPGPRKLTVIPMALSPGFESGGVVRFLSDGRVVAGSTDGWMKVVDLDTQRVRDMASRERAADEIVAPPRSNEIFVGRRSGIVSIYDNDGLMVGRLLGESSSDGLNPAFAHIRVSAGGNAVLTMAQDGLRLWRRPAFQLVIPRSPTARAFDKLSASATAAFRSVSGSTENSVVTQCDQLKTLHVDESGHISLCVRLAASERSESLPSGLRRADFTVVGSGTVDQIGQRLIAEQGDRLFVLYPDIIMHLVEQEARYGRLWEVDRKTRQMWIER